MRKLLTALVFLALPVQAQEVTSAPGGVLRALDKLSGQITDIEIATGSTARFGSLQIVLGDCRYPSGNPAGNAYAALEISEVEGSRMTPIR